MYSGISPGCSGGIFVGFLENFLHVCMTSQYSVGCVSVSTEYAYRIAKAAEVPETATECVCSVAAKLNPCTYPSVQCSKTGLFGWNYCCV